MKSLEKSAGVMGASMAAVLVTMIVASAAISAPVSKPSSVMTNEVLAAAVSMTALADDKLDSTASATDQPPYACHGSRLDSQSWAGECDVYGGQVRSVTGCKDGSQRIGDWVGAGHWAISGVCDGSSLGYWYYESKN